MAFRLESFFRWTVIILVGATLDITEAAAQNGGIIGVEYAAPVALGNLAPENPDLELGLTTFQVDVGYPFKIESTNTVLVPGINYRGTFPSVSEGSGVDFHEMGLKLTAIQSLSSSWNLVLLLNPSLATNFQNIDSNHLRFNSGLLALYQISESFQLGFGAFANYNFGEFLVLPGLQIDWRISEEFRFLMFLPTNARLSWRFLEFMEFGVASRLTGNLYNIEDSDNANVESLAYTVVDAHAFLDIRLFSNIWLSFLGGYTLFRNFEVRDVNGDPLGDQDFQNTPIFGLNLVFRQ